MKTTCYYYSEWKRHCLILLLGLVLASNGIAWSLVAILYGSAPWTIGLLLAAVFGIFVACVEYGACVRYHRFYIRSLTTPSPN
jgi:uncharacterized integral membrane protein